jgi:hypothetical protein
MIPRRNFQITRHGRRYHAARFAQDGALHVESAYGSAVVPIRKNGADAELALAERTFGGIVEAWEQARSRQLA